MATQATTMYLQHDQTFQVIIGRRDHRCIIICYQLAQYPIMQCILDTGITHRTQNLLKPRVTSSCLLAAPNNVHKERLVTQTDGSVPQLLVWKGST